MIKEDSIRRVLDACRIEEVIKDFVELTKSGSNYKGLSPFSSEKSPSFMVSPAKQIFKDFSSGKGGSAVTFLIEHKNMTYPDAINYLADKYNITLEHDQKEQTEEQKNTYEQMRQVAQIAAATYSKLLFDLPVDAPARIALAKRSYSADTIIEWGLGWAPETWRTITDVLMPRGLFEVARKMGLTGHKNGNNYDVFRNRIIFPIHNHRGYVVGFGGRAMGDELPKYLNSPESELYIKSNVLYGLFQSKKSIMDEGFAYLTEGYTDVISMHQAGVCNTVASCGTAITDKHLRLLGKYTKNIVVLTDGDAAGHRAALKTVELALKCDMNADVVILADGEDPDTLARKLATDEIPEPDDE
jgi:DNA primase